MGNNKRPNQCDRIKEYMEQFGEISQLDALRDLGVMRLASRISEMKKNGLNILKKEAKAKNRYGENVRFAVYYLGETK